MNTAPNTADYDLLYLELMVELGRLMKDDTGNESNRLTSAVLICEKYIGTVDNLVPLAGFHDIHDEVTYFKTMKPRFTSEREYYQLLYHANLFGENNNGFWIPEIVRVKKLLESVSGFVQYYHDGTTENDLAWFTHGQPQLPCVLCMKAYDNSVRHYSARDNWVAGLLALERYQQWLVNQIEINEKKNDEN